MKNCVDIRAFPEKYGVVMSHLNSVSRILKAKRQVIRYFSLLYHAKSVLYYVKLHIEELIVLIFYMFMLNQ